MYNAICWFCLVFCHFQMQIAYLEIKPEVAYSHSGSEREDENDRNREGQGDSKVSQD